MTNSDENLPLSSSQATPPPAESSNSNSFFNKKILCLTFNQEGTKILVGHEIGFNVLDSKTMEVQVNRKLNKAVGIVQIADCSNIFALRGGGLDPICKANEVLIWDEKLGKKVANLKFASKVVGIEMTKHL